MEHLTKNCITRIKLQHKSILNTDLMAPGIPRDYIQLFFLNLFIKQYMAAPTVSRDIKNRRRQKACAYDKNIS